MDGSRKRKNLVFGITDGTNRRHRPSREWVDDIVKWCKTAGYTNSEITQPVSVFWGSINVKDHLDMISAWTPTALVPYT